MVSTRPFEEKFEPVEFTCLPHRFLRADLLSSFLWRAVCCEILVPPTSSVHLARFAMSVYACALVARKNVAGEPPEPAFE